MISSPREGSILSGIGWANLQEKPRLRGFVFTEFIEMVEERYGIARVDRVIASADSSCDGAYVAVETYSHEEFARLVESLAGAEGAEPRALILWFGEKLFARLAVIYAHLLDGMEEPFDLLERLDGYVHFEVQKLEPEAQLPSFEFQRTGPSTATMIYRSQRSLPDLAEGLLIGCFEHFETRARIGREDRSGGAGTLVEFYVEQVVDPEHV
jgi:hypothetical protein